MSADVRQSRVAKGGFWSSKPNAYSPETHQLLKQMMQEAKLTNFQKKHLEETVQNGACLPVTCSPSSSEPQQCRSDSPPKLKSSYNYTGKRTRQTMEAMGAYKIDSYRPKPGKFFSEKEKEKLANLMTYGKEENIPRPKVLLRKPKIEEEFEDVDRFEELQQEIEDRRTFLEEMKTLGQDKKYRTIIETEISQKVREMEIIDKQRTTELEKMRSEKSNQEQPNNPPKHCSPDKDNSA
ncbi:Hypothetical predicted protein [Octopus vulgaris]|uniref:Uncharacterized protein n=2 Tax=Octopus TaxID=6643 RepID=A0AA36B6X6_OCTVU|nr:UPF0193 protein EVG1 homolog [Octopus sinensis]CAI9728474.1 Hypothetical predicted protein [Octopus vulgaris]